MCSKDESDNHPKHGQYQPCSYDKCSEGVTDPQARMRVTKTVIVNVLFFKFFCNATLHNFQVLTLKVIPHFHPFYVNTLQTSQ